MPMYLFARFEPRVGMEDQVREVIAAVIPSTRAEAGCVRINGYESIRGVKCFFIHSVWQDEAAFELHATLPHTVRFIARVETLIDHPLDITRSRPLDLSE